METLLIAVGALVGYLIAYRTYGRWLARKVFQLDNKKTVPSVALNDNRDYVPTSKSVLFGHHFTSIAGTGPIVGPAIAVIWGWLPALIWVLLGSVFIGAVHDFGALVVSMRNRGQTVGDVAGRVLTPRARLLFLLILFMALTIVLAIFGLVIASVFRQYPAAIFPCLVQIPIAVAIGSWLHRRGVGLFWPSILALAVMYLTVIWGDGGALGRLNQSLAQLETIEWVLVLLVYSYIASVLPVWLLLQPRDYINSLQLISALGLVLLGLVAAAVFGGAPHEGAGERPPLQVAAPAVRLHPQEAPPLMPFLFITIACGACSGFHCLVSSGTSSKQIRCETDAQFVGYGSMLTEGFLATLVILACVAGLGLGFESADGEWLTGEAAYNARYASWNSANGLAAKVGAFVDGAANFLKALGLSAGVSVALMGVLVASFAGTTLDTACRLQRYVIQELAAVLLGSQSREADSKPSTANPLVWLTNKHGATLFAVTLALTIAAIPRPGNAFEWANMGQGGMLLWPLFGATNQLLAGLAFMVITFFLWRRSAPDVVCGPADDLHAGNARGGDAHEDPAVARTQERHGRRRLGGGCHWDCHVGSGGLDDCRSVVDFSASSWSVGRIVGAPAVMSHAPAPSDLRRTQRQLTLTWVLLILLAVLFLAPKIRSWMRGGAAAKPREVTPRGALADFEQTTVDIFRQANPAVVFITTRARVSDGWSRRVFEVESGTGSGFVWDEQGHVVTNFHVIENASSHEVVFLDQSAHEAEVVGASPDHDLAVLKIRAAAEQLKPLKIGESHNLQVGQATFAIGNPFGLQHTLTTGVISARSRQIEGPSGRTIEDVIQIDAAINPGNSGGPLLDSAGRLIGVNTAIYSPSGTSAGVGFAIPVDTVNRVVPQIISQGRYQPPRLGIRISEEVNRAVARRLGITGVVVLGVEESAAASGLQGMQRLPDGDVALGDVIQKVNGQPIESVNDLLTALERNRVGDTVELTVLRDKKEQILRVTLQ